MSAILDKVKSSHQPILMVVSNPSVFTTIGGSSGSWVSELIRAWHLFTDAGLDVVVASPDGGEIKIDGYSDPRGYSGYSAEDILSLGFLSSSPHLKLLQNTKKLAEVLVPFYLSHCLMAAPSSRAKR